MTKRHKHPHIGITLRLHLGVQPPLRLEFICIGAPERRIALGEEGEVRDECVSWNEEWCLLRCLGFRIVGRVRRREETRCRPRLPDVQGDRGEEAEGFIDYCADYDKYGQTMSVMKDREVGEMEPAY